MDCVFNQERQGRTVSMFARISIAAALGALLAGAVMLWLQRGDAILLDLSSATARFLCL